MDNKYIEQLRTHVKDALRTDNMRYQHTLGVANTSACLAMCHGADMNKAYIAGLLHDCAKCVPDDVKIAECEQFGLPISDIEFESPYLLHSKLGAYYAAHKYNVEDDEICSAIQWHTTGKPAMTLLEKIVFIADYIEPYRNKAANLDGIRQMAFTDIDMAAYVILDDTLSYIRKTGRNIDTQTVDTYEYYKVIIKEREN